MGSFRLLFSDRRRIRRVLDLSSGAASAAVPIDRRGRAISYRRLRAAGHRNAGKRCRIQTRSPIFATETGTVTGLVGAMGGLGGFFPPRLLGFFRDRVGMIWPALHPPPIRTAFGGCTDYIDCNSACLSCYPYTQVLVEERGPPVTRRVIPWIRTPGERGSLAEIDALDPWR
jgi:hypothetical protein